MIALGSEVEDMVTGFRGIAVARLEYIDGTVQYGVRPRAAARRRMLDVEYIGVRQLRIVGLGVTGLEFRMQAPVAEGE